MKITISHAHKHVTACAWKTEIFYDEIDKQNLILDLKVLFEF